MKLPQREIDIYNHLLQSLLLKVRAEAGVRPEDIPLNVPLMFYGHWDDEEPLGSNTTAVVMQDLKSLGFRMVDKRIGCTVDEAKLTLTALAHYHALTMGLITKCKTENGAVTLPSSIQFIPEPPSFHMQILEMLKMYVPPFVQILKKSNSEEVFFICIISVICRQCEYKLIISLDCSMA